MLYLRLMCGEEQVIIWRWIQIKNENHVTQRILVKASSPHRFLMPITVIREQEKNQLHSFTRLKWINVVTFGTQSRLLDWEKKKIQNYTTIGHRIQRMLNILNTNRRRPYHQFIGIFFSISEVFDDDSIATRMLWMQKREMHKKALLSAPDCWRNVGLRARNFIFALRVSNQINFMRKSSLRNHFNLFEC